VSRAPEIVPGTLDPRAASEVISLFWLNNQLIRPIRAARKQTGRRHPQGPRRQVVTGALKPSASFSTSDEPWVPLPLTEIRRFDGRLTSTEIAANILTILAPFPGPSHSDILT
jgi:hypothetical protein